MSLSWLPFRYWWLDGTASNITTNISDNYNFTNNNYLANKYKCNHDNINLNHIINNYNN